MTALRPDLPELPKRFTKLPLDARGYPVPAFVGVGDDGEFDFRVIKPGYRLRAWRHKRCWLCGEPLGQYRYFVIGPMCVVNRVTAEPPSHLDCAEFAVKACPFLARPLAKRPDRPLPAGSIAPPGEMIARNPGVTALVRAASYRPLRTANGQLIMIEPPLTVTWWREGRPATLAEVQHSIDTGLPALMDAAQKQGPDAVAELERCMDAARRYLPEASG